MNNQQWNNKLLHFNDTRNAHDDINISYANLLDTLYVEMETHLKVRGKRSLVENSIRELITITNLIGQRNYPNSGENLNLHNTYLF